MTQFLFGAEAFYFLEQVRIPVYPSGIRRPVRLQPLVRNRNRAVVLLRMVQRRVHTMDVKPAASGSFPDPFDSSPARLVQDCPIKVGGRPGSGPFNAGNILGCSHDVRKRFQRDTGVSPYSSAVRFLAQQVELIAGQLLEYVSQGVAGPLQVSGFAKIGKNPLSVFRVEIPGVQYTTDPVLRSGRTLGISDVLVVDPDRLADAGYDEQRPVATLAYRKVAILLVRLAVSQIVFFRSQFPAQGIQRFFHHLRNLFVDLSLPDLNACVRTMTVFTLLMLPALASAQGTTDPITVYTVAGLPVSVPRELSANTTVIHLDRARIIEEELARGIHALAPETRLEAVQGRFTPSVQQEVVRLWQALGWVREHATHLPAIRIGDRSLYYGFNLRRAVALHQRGGG